MIHSKKNSNLWRCAASNVVLGFLILGFPFLILQSYSSALYYLAVLSTLTSLNTTSINRKSIFSGIFTPSMISEERSTIRKNEKKDYLLSKLLMSLLFGIIIYYIVCILFGAAVFEDYSATLYFSIQMTLLTVCPLAWHYFFNENFLSILKILSDTKCEGVTEFHLHAVILWTVFGAWLGAFPIPLDWDRPWQRWPITCCIGASVGNGAAHILLGLRLALGLVGDRKKATSSDRL